MKKTLLLFLLLNGVYIWAQREFAPIGATWYYSKVENFAGEEGYVKIVSERDTIIEGKPSRVLSQKYYSASGDIIVRDNFFVHQNGDTIFYWIDNAFRIQYNFSPTTSDTMVIYSSELMCPKNTNHFGKIKVDKVSSTIINGIELKEILTSPVAGSVYQYPGSYIEIIGGRNGLYPIDTGCSSDAFPTIGKLRCYSDSTIGLYQIGKNIPCDTFFLITDIQKIKNNSNIKVNYINSTSIEIILQDINLINKISVNIYDIMGKEIYSSKIDKNFYNLNLSGKPNGIYLIQIRNNEKIFYNEKMLSY